MREEPRFVTARAGESVILGCDVSPPLDGQQPPYVVEWFKFGVPIPFFINFRFYPPHVDPEYTGELSAHVAQIWFRLEVIQNVESLRAEFMSNMFGIRFQDQELFVNAR